MHLKTLLFFLPCFTFNCFTNSFTNRPDSPRELIISVSFIFSFEIIIVIMQDPNALLWIILSVAYAAAVSLNGIKTLSANSLSTFLIKGNPVFGSDTKYSPDCPILCNWVFDDFTLADELFAKALTKLWSLCIS